MPVSPDAILSVIAAEAGLDESALRPEATFEELDIGSLDVASALFALEDRFGIEIDPAAILPSSTIGEFVRHVTDLATR